VRDGFLGSATGKSEGIPAAIVLPALLVRFLEAEKRQNRNSQLVGLPLVQPQAGRGRLDKLPQLRRVIRSG
jgi:hypothetical protein